MEFNLRFLSLPLILTFLIGCSSPDQFVESPRESQGRKGLNALTTHLIKEVIHPGYQSLFDSAFKFDRDLAKYCGTGTFPANETIKQSYKRLLNSYHYTEAFQVGEVAYQGHALREKIYPWPTVNAYQMDLEVAKAFFNKPYKYSTQTSARGLPALERYLYSTDLNDGCEDCGEPMLEKFVALSDLQKFNLRCRYMKSVARDISLQAMKLAESWKPVRGDVTLSSGYQKHFRVQKEFALKLVHSMIFTDQSIKDYKIGAPAGISRDHCKDDSCPDLSEHIDSKHSIESLYHTTRGLLAIFTGTNLPSPSANINSSYGFDDWLTSKGHAGLSKKMVSALLSFYSNLERLKGKKTVEDLSLEVDFTECEQTTTKIRKNELCALHSDIKRFTDLYKNEFLLAADFGRPVDQGGDPD